MEIGLHLLLQGEVLHNIAFEHRGVIADLLEDRRRENKESTIDPSSFALWLFLEGGNCGPINARPPNRAGGCTAVTVTLRP